ncbi:MAG: apolipoprotein N-acyltransferase [Paracoccaceae bacterium]|nr:apolipoprotein N-acyltransferase [Paracoccaceae bacterium]
MSGAKALALAVLSGLAAGLGHAPFGLWPVALAGFAGLIFLIARSERPGRLAWAGGAAYFGLTLHWIVEPFLVDVETHGWMAPFALLLMAGGLALFWGLAGWTAKHMAGPRALTFAVALAAAEVVRGHIFTGFPWALPGYIWVDTPLRLVASVTGSYGLTALTLIAAALPAALPRLWPGALAGAVLLGGLVLGAQIGPGRLPSGVERLGTVRLIQPNIPQTEKWDRARIPENFETKLDLTRGSGDADPPDLVVWPEAAVVTPLDVAGPALEAIGAAGGVPFITGINRRDGGDWFNSLVVAGPDGRVRETFDKVHLVPFGEYIPFRLGVLRAMAGTTSNGFSAGAEVRLIDTPLGRALPLICYEGIFPGHLFRAGERPDYIVILTNDAWFGTFAGPRQHLDIARFRAVEHGLPVVRVANKGVSTVIGPLGRTRPEEALRADIAGARDMLVIAMPGVPLYARTGDSPVFVLLLIGLVTGLVLHWRNPIAQTSGLE